MQRYEFRLIFMCNEYLSIWKDRRAMMLNRHCDFLRWSWNPQYRWWHLPWWKMLRIQPSTNPLKHLIGKQKEMFTFTGSLPKWLQWWGLSLAEARSRDFLQGVALWCPDPSSWYIPLYSHLHQKGARIWPARTQNNTRVLMWHTSMLGSSFKQSPKHGS